MRGLEQIPWLYDLGMAALDWTGFSRWRVWLVGGARGKTLEVGCGTGRNLPFYNGEACPVGLELDARMLSRARKRAPEVPLVVASAEELPFREGAFETVVSSLVFCSVREPDRGLQEIRRVLAKSGRLRMIEHVRSELPVIAKLQDLGQPAWTAFSGGCHPNRETVESVRKAGFAIEEGSLRASRSIRRFSASPR